MLDLVDRIPPGRVLSYGDVAGHLGMGSARQVGQVLARHGHEVPWHRVVMSDGRPAPHKPGEHLARLRAEGVPVADGRVDMERARWRPRTAKARPRGRAEAGGREPQAGDREGGGGWSASRSSGR